MGPRSIRVGGRFVQVDQSTSEKQVFLVIFGKSAIFCRLKRNLNFGSVHHKIKINWQGQFGLFVHKYDFSIGNCHRFISFQVVSGNERSPKLESINRLKQKLDLFAFFGQQ